MSSGVPVACAYSRRSLRSSFSWSTRTLVTADRDQSDKGCNVEALVSGLSLEVLQVVFQSINLIKQTLHALEQSRELLRCSRVLTDRHHHLLLLLTAGPPAALRRWSCRAYDETREVVTGSDLLASSRRRRGSQERCKGAAYGVRHMSARHIRSTALTNRRRREAAVWEPSAPTTFKRRGCESRLKVCRMIRG